MIILTLWLTNATDLTESSSFLPLLTQVFLKNQIESKYKRIICVLRNYNFRFQEKNLNLDWDSNLEHPEFFS